MTNTKGALLIYDKVIYGFFKKYEGAIDKGLKKLEKAGKKVMGKTKKVIDDNKDKIMDAGVEAGKVINDAMKKTN